VIHVVPNSRPSFWIVCALTLAVAPYQLFGRLNIVYKITGMFVVVALMPLTARVARMLAKLPVVRLCGSPKLFAERFSQCSVLSRHLSPEDRQYLLE
jgi:hypothetical protein